ncbi:MAG TPA: FG-GAP-like repeat-containing protein [Telluria sp.]|nr:FG-GAP-like repeat-containing protein [Telluria sp.]
MNYQGTAGDDNLDQATLGLPAGSNIYGGAGNDTIKVSVGNALGEAGNDTIIGTGDYAAAAYWNSPAGVVANLATGTVQDGFGGTDTLQNIRVFQDSGHNDHITGSERNEDIWTSWGSDTIVGGGGTDTVYLYNVKSTEVSITYDIASDTFTMVKNTAAGDKGTNKLTGISRISFTGPQSDNVNVTRDMFDFSDGFLRAPSSALSSFDTNKIQQMRAADFNGDGKVDILVVRANNDLGLTAEPLQILIGDGTGKFSDQTASFFKDGVIPKVNYVPRIFAADFNKDGITDIFNPDFGYDAPPFPGGQNSLFLSNPATKLLENATASLPQALLQSHGTSIGDINRDGFPDVLVNVLHDYTGRANLVMMNDGTGHFVVKQDLLPPSLRQSGYDAGYTWSMLRDINNDGWDDMVLGTWDANGGPSLVVLNKGGSFATSTPIALPATGLDRQVVIGIETIDLNGDALPDLVLSATNGGSHGEFYKVPYLQLLVNLGNGQFRDETASRLPQSKDITSTSANWYLSATPIDLNGDGFQDIVTDASNPYAGSRVFMNDGTGKFTEGWRGGSYVHVLPVDVNGDGKPDLVEASSNGWFSVLMNAFPNRVPGSGVYRAGDAGERIVGGSAMETIYSGKGNDTIDAGAGLDTVVYSGNRAGFTIAKTDAGFTVSGALGTDTLVQVERLSFGDTAVALDIDSVGGQAYRVYNAVLGRTPDAAGLGYWMASMDKGMSLGQVASYMIAGEEFIKNFGANLSNQALVQTLYQNILDRAPEQAGLAYWVDALDKGLISQAEALAFISEGFENRANVDPTIATGFPYAPWG